MTPRASCKYALYGFGAWMSVVSGAYGAPLCANALPASAAAAASTRVAIFFIFFFLFGVLSVAKPNNSAFMIRMVTRTLSCPFRIAKQAINFSAILPYTPQPHVPGPNQTRRIGRCGVVSSQHDGIVPGQALTIRQARQRRPAIAQMP
jgi:hypothetical protein